MSRLPCGIATRRSCHGGDDELEEAITWLLVAFVIFYLIQAPDQSARTVTAAGQALGSAMSSVATFIDGLV